MVVNYLLNYWLKQGWTQETTICHLHDPLCTCASKSKIAVIDFDAVKRGYEKQHGIASPTSVDALRNDEKELTFIEIKGWRKFLQFSRRVNEEKMLATLSTSWDTMCWQKTQSDVDQIPQEDYSDLNMKHPHLISCVDFDTCF